MAKHRQTVMSAVMVAAIGAGVVATWASQRATRQPRLEVSPLIGLGELTYDREVALTIGFRNAGNAVLNVAPPIPGCACAPAELSKRVLQPGEAATFSFKLRPASPAGTDFLQQVTIPSNDPLQPRRIVVFQGRMRNGLVSLPGRVRVASWPLGSTWQGVVTVTTAMPAGPFELAECKSSLEGLTILGIVPRHDATQEGANAFDVSLAFEGRAPGEWSGEISCRPDRSDLGPLSIPVSLLIESALRLVPRSCLLTQGGPDESAEVRIEGPPGVRLKLSDETSTSAPLDVTLDGGPEASNWRARIALRKDVVVDSVTTGVVGIDVEGVPGERRVEIPVTILPNQDIVSALRP